MSARLDAITYEAVDPERLARFWGRLLDRDGVDEQMGFLLPGSDRQVGLRFVAGDAPDRTSRRLHLHLTSDGPGDQERTVASVLALGGSHLDVGQDPDEGHVVLADPEGNELCVIEHGNNFLAGCGFLGEVACDGTRELGVFWAAVLDWPLVWDQDQETAIQSPHGGTKVAWGGPPLEPKRRRNRQRFSVTTDERDLDDELDRLTSLGATVVGPTGGGAVELTDPDGNEFVLAAV